MDHFILGLIIPPMLFFLFLGYRQERRGCAAMISIILLVTELIIIILLILHPLIINRSGSTLTAESEEIIRYISNGRFNNNTSTFPIAVVVTENSESHLRWRTCYGIWGSTEHIWDVKNKCYECTDRL